MDDKNESDDKKVEIWFNGQRIDGENFNGNSSLSDLFDIKNLKDLPKSDKFIPGLIDGSAKLELHYESVDVEAFDLLVKSLTPSFEMPIMPGHYADLVRNTIEAAKQQNCKPVQLLMSEALMAGLWEETRHMLIGDTSDIQIADATGEFWGVPFKQVDLPEGLLGRLETDVHWAIDIRE